MSSIERLPCNCVQHTLGSDSTDPNPVQGGHPVCTPSYATGSVICEQISPESIGISQECWNILQQKFRVDLNQLFANPKTLHALVPFEGNTPPSTAEYRQLVLMTMFLRSWSPLPPPEGKPPFPSKSDILKLFSNDKVFLDFLNRMSTEGSAGLLAYSNRNPQIDEAISAVLDVLSGAQVYEIDVPKQVVLICPMQKLLPKETFESFEPFKFGLFNGQFDPLIFGEKIQEWAKSFLRLFKSKH